MEQNTLLIEPLLDRFKDYGKTSLELVKLRSVDKTADLLSMLISRLLYILTIVISLITFNIAISLWLGNIMGKTYDGFLVVAAFYAVVALILYLMQPSIKARVNDSIIRLMIK